MNTKFFRVVSRILIPRSWMPVFLFAYANDKNRSLRFLSDEEKGTNRALSDLQEDVFVKILGTTEWSDINENFNRHHGKILLFHFSGHSDSLTQRFEDLKGNAESLAAKFRLESSLFLVFINGCSNKQQVDKFLANGVNVVIATSDDIEDSKAKEFAIAFYAALSKNISIKNSFTTALSTLNTPEVFYNNNSYRGIASKAPTVKIPWGLYFLDEKDSEKTISNLLDEYRHKKITPVTFSLVKRAIVPLTILIFIIYLWSVNANINHEYVTSLEKGNCIYYERFSKKFQSAGFIEKVLASAYLNKLNEKLDEYEFLIVGRWEEEYDSDNWYQFSPDGLCVAGDISKSNYRYWSITQSKELVFRDQDKVIVNTWKNFKLNCSKLTLSSNEKFNKK